MWLCSFFKRKGMAMMASFVKLTKQSDGAPIFVNPDHLIDISSISGGTQLTTTGTNSTGASKTIVVKENLNAIIEALLASVT